MYNYKNTFKIKCNQKVTKMKGCCYTVCITIVSKVYVAMFAKVPPRENDFPNSALDKNTLTQFYNVTNWAMEQKLSLYSTSQSSLFTKRYKEL